MHTQRILPDHPHISNVTNFLMQDEEKGCGNAEACGHNSHGSHEGHSHIEDNINMRGAVIHALGDLVQSVGVVIASAIIWWKEVRNISSHVQDLSSSPYCLELAMLACTFVWLMKRPMIARKVHVHAMQTAKPMHAKRWLLKQGHWISCCACNLITCGCFCSHCLLATPREELTEVLMGVHRVGVPTGYSWTRCAHSFLQLLSS